MTANSGHTGNGLLDEIVEKMETMRDSVEEVLEDLEELEERQRYCGNGVPYGLAPEEDYNGDA